MFELVAELKALLDARHAPAGYNVGFNDGAAAGQTIEHLHIHVIPRYLGDVADPRGGIRWVIPEKANYIAPTPPASAAVRLVDSIDDRKLRLELLRCLINEHFDRIDLVVSFIMRSGLDLVGRHLDAAVERGAEVRVLTTDYLAITHPDALHRLLDLATAHSATTRRGGVSVRVFQDRLTSFHPKAYIFSSSRDRIGRGFVGSNNLSRSGIEDGVEWAIETDQVASLTEAFEGLWTDRRSVEVDESWLADYRTRFREQEGQRERRGTEDEPVVVETLVEPPWEPPTPRAPQAEALLALKATRDAGHRAGLVVMATGLGKTWLSAFDSDRPDFPRVLFVAHREEILRQARDVFRQVRPNARLGFFTAEEKVIDADIVFATVQTLHRHLSTFTPAAFEYVVVDEFHHAAAATYRRVVSHFEPRFLLGLTATPERLDGADLLALCGDNLVYRCDLIDGIERNELVPFRYWGVADTIDFTPIPWRNGRFDPAALEVAVATEERADATLREWSNRAGERTLGFCSSIRHADYMARHFSARGIAAVALHSGSEPGLRLRAVEQLENSELSVLFTVDLFNEGVDLPTLDTVLMLRPTESPVVFLQQLGRGLRIAADKSHLNVVDFVGNHRAFLAPLRTLMSLRLGRAPTTRELLDALESGQISLPAGCSVDYELRAIELLADMVRQRRTGATDVLRDLCVEFAEEQGLRPSALQVALAGGNVRAARTRSGGWFPLLEELGLLADAEQAVIHEHGRFFNDLATTPMTKSFKMVLLQALLRDGHLHLGLPVSDLAARSLHLIQADPRLAADVDTAEIPSVNVVETSRWEAYWTRNPIAAWIGGEWFAVSDGVFAPRFQVGEELQAAFDAMTAEIVEWRLHDYLRRGGETTGPNEMELRVSHSGGTPIIRLDRGKMPGLPDGDIEFLADGDRYLGRFMKVALNVATEAGSDGNALPALLRTWFGPSAGHPGSDHRVVLTSASGPWVLRPLQPRMDGAVLPHFPTYAVACGAFDNPVPADAAPRHQPIAGLQSADPEEFLVTIRGDSMDGGRTPLRHGDLARMRWTKRRSVDSFIGKPVLVEMVTGGTRQPALKVLEQSPSGLLLRSTHAGYPDVQADRSMVVVGELIERVDPAAWNPLAKWLGHEFTRQTVPPLLGDTYGGRWAQPGHVSLPEDTVFFVTLEKKAGRAGEDYVDRFDDESTFHWTSQTSTKPDGKKGREVLEALDTARRIHLFVRRRYEDRSFTYVGLLAPVRHEGSLPMTVWFNMLTPLSGDLARRFLG